MISHAGYAIDFIHLVMRYIVILICFLNLQAFAQQPGVILARLQTASEGEKIGLYTELSQAYAAAQPDSAVHYANLGMRIAEKLNNRQGQASLLLTLGHINALHEHTNLARSFFNEALGLYRRLGDAAGVAHSYDQLGSLDGNAQNFNSALKFYRDSRDSGGLIGTYVDMGKSAENKGEYELALSWYLRALTQYEHRKQKPEAYFTLLENISKLYQLKGNTAKSLYYLQEGISRSIKQGSRENEIHLLNDEGKLFMQNHKERALPLYKKALAEAKKYKQPDEQAEALIGIAGILKEQNTLASIRNLQQALDIARKLHEPKLAARIYEALAAAYRQQKNYVEALSALEEQRHLVDSLLGADTVKDIAALDSSYVLERSREKMQTLEILNRKEKVELWLAIVLSISVCIILFLFWLYLRKVRRLNNQLQQLNEELTNSNQVKDTLFSVIGHDLKGPAGSAVQLFEMMETEDFTPAEMKGMISEARKQTSASFQLLQSLFEWSKAQLKGITVNLTDILLQPVIQRCIHLLSQQAAQKNISLVTDLTDGLKLHADVDHLEFIVRNILSNAIKFSYEGTTITISAHQASSAETIISIEDHGIGISKEQQAVFLTGNLKANFGTRNEKGSGLGLLLTKDFVKANRGKIWLESTPGKGSTFHVAIPAA